MFYSAVVLLTGYVFKIFPEEESQYTHQNNMKSQETL